MLTTMPSFGAVHVSKLAVVHPPRPVVVPAVGFRQLHATAATPPGLVSVQPAGNEFVTMVRMPLTSVGWLSA